MHRKATVLQMHKIRDIAIESGIYNAFFPGFGTLLGMIRNGNLIKHDDDTDMCIMSEKISKEKEDVFFNKLCKYDMFKKRRREHRRTDDGRLLHLSLKSNDVTAKSCIWFFFKYKNYYFHSKGDNWVAKIGLYLKPEANQKSEAIAKGIPAYLFDKFISYEFKKKFYQIPEKYGTILDMWYPNWKIPKAGGTSSEEMLLIIDRWSDEKTWKMRRR